MSKFRITNGKNIISIHHSDMVTYLRLQRLSVVAWYDCRGSVGKYLSLLPNEYDFDDKFINNLSGDYTYKEEELLNELAPLLEVFQNGEYSIQFHSGEIPSFFRSSADYYGKPYWKLLFTAKVTNKLDQQKIKIEYDQWFEERTRKGEHTCDILEYTTNNFYEGHTPTLIASEPLSSINTERVRYYEEKIKKGERPFAIILNSFENYDSTESFVIDGHHKLQAYSNLGILPHLVELTHHPNKDSSVNIDIEALIEKMHTWQIEHILKKWYNKDVELAKYISNPTSTIHQFIKNGFVKEYYDSGQLKHQAFYMNDKIDGKALYWYGNGVVKSEEYYKNGINQGNWKQYYKSGKLCFVQSFDNDGRYDGDVISYYENGNIRFKKQYESGFNIDGYSYVCWYENGIKEAELQYSSGRMIERRNYDENGHLINYEVLDLQTNKLVKNI